MLAKYREFENSVTSSPLAKSHKEELPVVWKQVGRLWVNIEKEKKLKSSRSIRLSFLTIVFLIILALPLVRSPPVFTQSNQSEVLTPPHTLKQLSSLEKGKFYLNEAIRRSEYGLAWSDSVYRDSVRTYYKLAEECLVSALLDTSEAKQVRQELIWLYLNWDYYAFTPWNKAKANSYIDAEMANFKLLGLTGWKSINYYLARIYYHWVRYGGLSAAYLWTAERYLKEAEQDALTRDLWDAIQQYKKELENTKQPEDSEAKDKKQGYLLRADSGPLPKTQINTDKNNRFPPQKLADQPLAETQT